MNKKYIVFGLMGLFAAAIVSAGLVTYYSQVKIDMSIESPVTLVGEITEKVELIAGGGYNIYFVEGENVLDRDVNVKFQFSLLDGSGAPIEDTNGFYLAYSDDVSYYFNPYHGSCDGPTETGCGPSVEGQTVEEWMLTFPDWGDWYLTGNLVDYDSSMITNHGGNSAHSVLSFNEEIPEDLSPGKFYAVIYLDVDESVTPGDYTLSIDMMPVVA